MKAVVQYEYKPNGVKVESNYPEPVVGPGLVKIKVVRAGVCGSDIHQWRATLSGMRINTPVVLGHEFSGIVEEVGEGCTLGYKPGDRVVAENGYGVCGIQSTSSPMPTHSEAGADAVLTHQASRQPP